VKKFIFFMIVAAFMASMATVFANFGYVGNANSHKFHYSDCFTLKNMNPKNRVNFSSRDAAIKAGYVPCKHCNP